jgi:hypothetical protein
MADDPADPAIRRRPARRDDENLFRGANSHGRQYPRHTGESIIQEEKKRLILLLPEDAGGVTRLGAA